MNEEEYLRMYDALNKDAARDYLAGYIRNEFDRIPHLAGISEGSDCVDLGISTKKEPKKNPTLAETMDLLARGLKPYFYDLMENDLIELTLATETQRRNSDIHWLAPKIAEKIQERYAEINRLADEKRKAIEDYDAKIEELERRVDLILENGTDLLI
jgi:predicted ribosome quality control (RQC) complex YloA/Tae2 family protein